MNIWLMCYLAFLEDRVHYAPTDPRYPKDYESYLLAWHNDFCND